MAHGWWHRRGSAARRADTGAHAPGESSAASTAPPWALPRATILLLGLAAAVVAVFGMAAARSVVAPVFLALVLTICVHPLRRMLERRGVPRGLATGSAIVAVFALLAGFFAALYIALVQFTALLPEYADEIEAGLANLAAGLEAIGIGEAQAETIVDGLEPSRAIEIVTGFLGGITGIVFSLVIVLTLLILMAMDAGYGPAILRQLRIRRPALVDALVGFTVNVRRYMVVTAALGAAQGVINWLALLFLQVPGAALWGLLSFICSFIPNIGYFIAIIPPLVFGFLSGGWPTERDDHVRVRPVLVAGHRGDRRRPRRAAHAARPHPAHRRGPLDPLVASGDRRRARDEGSRSGDGCRGGRPGARRPDGTRRTAPEMSGRLGCRSSPRGRPRAPAGRRR
jgi:AI-2 transport protein TqsA